MNLRLAALVPWMVLAGVAHGQVRSADVLYTFHETVPSPGYRVGDECFVAIETAELWGWKVKTDGSVANVDAEGHTLHLGIRFLRDRTTIPLRQAIKQLGGETDWTAGTDTLNVFSTLKVVATSNSGLLRNGPESPSPGSPAKTGSPTPPAGGRGSALSAPDAPSTTQDTSVSVRASAPLAFKAFPFYLNPGRTVVDLDGVRLGPDTKQTFAPGSRMFQYRTNVVRILVDTAYVPKLSPATAQETNDLDLEIARDPEQPAPEVQNPVPTPPVAPGAVQPTSVPMTITVDQDSETTTTLGFHLQAFQGQATISQPEPDTIEIVLPGIATEVSAGFKAPTNAVESVESRPSGGSTVLTLKLARPMGSEITSSATGVTLSLLKPNVGDGRLAGKVIVVDPGHGGHDRGAHEGALNEKDLTLAIGKRLAHKLAEAGATVIMTRQTDVFIPLMTRSQISNSNHADFFISCHINSTGGSGSQSGTITFHHLGNRVGNVLAESIQHEIAKVNHLPNLGAWSDGRIYSTGFSVLRHTNAPAVLIEYGFINNAHDRARIITDDFQDAVTTAVVKGLRVFLGESKSNG